MATDQILDGTSQEGQQQQEPVKITFTDEQQLKVNELIDKAIGRSRANANREHEAKIVELSNQLAELKSAKPGKTTEETEAAKQEYKSIAEAAKAETERFKLAAQEQAKETAAARAEAQEVRKEVAITSAAAKIPFFNVDIVKVLTKDSIAYDAELGQFVVKGPNGQTRYDATLEKPLSLEAYYTEFAAQNKYLVRSDMASGTGSSEASRKDVASNGRFEVKDIFGKTSSAAKAQKLMAENPTEYRRLKAIAKSEGVI